MTSTASAPRAHFNAERIVADMALRGWNNTDLARATGLSNQTISLFLLSKRQTPKVAALIAKALGYSVRRYFSHVEAA